MYTPLSKFLPEDQALLISIMIITIPLSFLLNKLKQKYLKLCVSVGFTILFQSLIFPTEKYFLWIQQQIVFLLIKFGPRKNIGKIVLIESMAYLAIVQIRRMYIAYGINGVDITGILMMQTFLYIGLAYNYQNGLKSDDLLTQDAAKRKVINTPQYITYIGYVFFLPASMVGPVFQYRDYQDFLNSKGEYENMPSTLKPALNQLGIFLIALTIYLGSDIFDIWQTVKPEFAQHSYIFKLLYMCAVIIHIQFKYITAWSLGMISIHASGLSYRKQTNKFDKIAVTDLWGFFFEPSLKVKTQCWNMSVQVALKRYIYQQQYNLKKVYPDEKTRKKVQARAQRNTLMLSALWHGFYIGYFIAFFNWMIYLRMTQQLFRLRKLNKSVENLWTNYRFGIVQNLISHFVFCYFGMFFHVHTAAYDWIIFKITYGIPFFVLYGLYFVIYEAQMFSKPKKSKSQISDSTKQGSVKSPQQFILKEKQKAKVV